MWSFDKVLGDARDPITVALQLILNLINKIIRLSAGYGVPSRAGCRGLN